MKGVLLMNLGTPDAPKELEVKKYLGEFLMDPYVIDIPFLARYLLVNGIILRKRPKESAEAYSKIWTDEGSPLLFHLKNLSAKVQDRLYPQIKVTSAMRYGNPTVEQALDKLVEHGVTELLVLPLYPQYSKATTYSTMEHVRSELEKFSWKPEKVFFADDFYNDSGFVASYGAQIQHLRNSYNFDHLLMSFHGLPERQIKKSDPNGYCLKTPHCCDVLNEKNKKCYRAQCFESARLIASYIGLPNDMYSVSFQSRLGKGDWIKPYTDQVIDRLIERGVRKLAVVCPAFVSDCLETLEEIQMRLKEDFVVKGGEDLKLVPALNSEAKWAEALASFITQQFAEQSVR
jgi:ferrochelatase